MHDLVQAASVALSVNDAETLERLASEARSMLHSSSTLNLAELVRVAHVLARQVNVAEAHLDLRSRMNGNGSNIYKANPWAL